MPKQTLSHLWNSSQAFTYKDVLSGTLGKDVYVISDTLNIYHLRRVDNTNMYDIHRPDDNSYKDFLSPDKVSNLRILPIQNNMPVYCKSHGHGLVIGVKSPGDHGIGREFGVVYTVYYNKLGAEARHVGSGALLLNSGMVLDNFVASYISQYVPPLLKVEPEEAEIDGHRAVTSTAHLPEIPEKDTTANESTKVNLQGVNDLRGVQVDDRLYHIARGWGTVTTVSNSKFRMKFKGRSGTFEYYFNGVSVLDDSTGNASVFWSVPTIIPPARPMKVDTPVAILTASGEHLYFAYVHHQNELRICAHDRATGFTL